MDGHSQSAERRTNLLENIFIDLTIGQSQTLAVHYDLVALGLNTVDVLVRLPPQIKKDDKQMVADLIIQGGAPAGSGACGVAHFGYDVAFVARIGKGTLTSINIEEFHRNGVRTDLFIRDEDSRPAIALVEIDPATAGRTVFIQMDHYGYLRPDDIPVEAIRASRALLVDSYDLDATEAALRAAAGTKCRTILDFESGDPERTKSLLAFGTDPILPLGWARKLTGQDRAEAVVHALSRMTSGQVIVTDGRHGSWAWDRQSRSVRHQPAFQVESIDSTGCGDAYHAGYTIAVLERWSLALGMEFGALLAAKVATKVGGRTALPWRKDARSLLHPAVSSELRTLIENLHDNTHETPR